MAKNKNLWNWNAEENMVFFFANSTQKYKFDHTNEILHSIKYYSMASDFIRENEPVFTYNRIPTLDES